MRIQLKTVPRGSLFIFSSLLFESDSESFHLVGAYETKFAARKLGFARLLKKIYLFAEAMSWMNEVPYLGACRLVKPHMRASLSSACLMVLQLHFQAPV